MKGKILTFFITILLAAFMFFVSYNKTITGEPNEVYQVYLDGKKIGLIKSKEAFFDLINKEQQSIKDKYKVKNVYPPEGLEIEKIYTYDNDIVDEQEIYNKIKETEPFTIEGYILKITYTEEIIQNDIEGTGKIPDPIYIYLLNKDIVKEALYNTAAAFIGSKGLKNYDKGTQVDIEETGEFISSVYFSETISVQKGLVSTEEYLFSDVDELSKYLLYSTLEDQKKYTVRAGENLDAIADNNHLNIEELLIANPQFASANVLLSAGDTVNVGLINPLVNVVYRKTVINDVVVSHKTEYINDNTKSVGYREVVTKGQDGVNRISQDVKYVNGEINNLIITNRETIKNVVNEVIKRGTRINESTHYNYENVAGNDKWSWPTISPFVITSRFKWRWGRQHQGIDISGMKRGSPVYAVNNGYVFKINTDPHKNEGLCVYLDHGNGVITQYMHLDKILVSVGQTVKREQKIGLMGSTGRSTGPHLHLGVWKNGKPYQGGVAVDPCNSIFKC